MNSVTVASQRPELSNAYNPPTRTHQPWPEKKSNVQCTNSFHTWTRKIDQATIDVSGGLFGAPSLNLEQEPALVLFHQAHLARRQ
jgi:hypothetical protein